MTDEERESEDTQRKSVDICEREREKMEIDCREF
jgi:hypothetical protein